MEWIACICWNNRIVAANHTERKKEGEEEFSSAFILHLVSFVPMFYKVLHSTTLLDFLSISRTPAAPFPHIYWRTLDLIALLRA